MDENKLERALSLKEEIEELEKFLHTIGITFPTKSKTFFCHLIMVKEKTKYLKLRGWRHFGVENSAFDDVINIPLSIMSDIVELTKNRLTELKKEYLDL